LTPRAQWCLQLWLSACWQAFYKGASPHFRVPRHYCRNVLYSPRLFCHRPPAAAIRIASRNEEYVRDRDRGRCVAPVLLKHREEQSVMNKIGSLALAALLLTVCSLASTESKARGEEAAGRTDDAAKTATGGSAAGRSQGDGYIPVPQGTTAARVCDQPPPKAPPHKWSVQPGGWVNVDVSRQGRSPSNP